MRDASALVSLESIDCSLLQGYALYLAIRQLWHKAVHSTAGVFVVTHKCVQTTLSVFEDLCSKTEPREITVLLLRDVSELRTISSMSLYLRPFITSTC